MLQVNCFVCWSISTFKASKQLWRAYPQQSSFGRLLCFTVPGLRTISSCPIFFDTARLMLPPHRSISNSAGSTAEKGWRNEWKYVEVGGFVLGAIIPMSLKVESGLVGKKWHWWTWVCSIFFIFYALLPTSQSFIIFFWIYLKSHGEVNEKIEKWSLRATNLLLWGQGIQVGKQFIASGRGVAYFLFTFQFSLGHISWMLECSEIKLSILDSAVEQTDLFFKVNVGQRMSSFQETFPVHVYQYILFLNRSAHDFLSVKSCRLLSCRLLSDLRTTLSLSIFLFTSLSGTKSSPLTNKCACTLQPYCLSTGKWLWLTGLFSQVDWEVWGSQKEFCVILCAFWALLQESQGHGPHYKCGMRNQHLHYQNGCVNIEATIIRRRGVGTGGDGVPIGLLAITPHTHPYCLPSIIQ